MPDRKQNRVRIDAILNAIRKGEYDDKLGDIRSSVDARLEHKRQEVLALVQEVYGSGYTVAPQGSKLQRANIPVVSSGSPAMSDEEEIEDALGPEPEVPEGPDGPDEKGFESRSPIIGPFNPS